MNNSNDVVEMVNDEQLLEQLVQELFLSHLRRELDIIKNLIEETKETLFNSNRHFTKENGKLVASIDNISERLDAQICELNDVKDDALKNYRCLLNCMTQVGADSAASYEKIEHQLATLQQQFGQEQNAQSEQLQCTQEHIIHICSDIQEKNKILAALIEQSEAQSQLLVKQDEILTQQLVAMRDDLFKEIHNNRRHGMWGLGITLVSTLALVGLIVLCKII